MKNEITFLTLGDSYTIGEAVPLHGSFPYQVVQLMRRDGYLFHAPEIIAKTGWTTGELQSALSSTRLLPSYDFVGLLIGVNNQYRGGSIDEYKQQFEFLLKKSIRLAANKSSRVIVLSIPDWGATPFAEGRDRKKISQEIDQFNAVNAALSNQHQTHYMNITVGSRVNGKDLSFMTADNLHPSEKEYARWATLIAEVMQKQLIKEKG
jgi:lysophospholipase L1-like esterase